MQHFDVNRNFCDLSSGKVYRRISERDTDAPVPPECRGSILVPERHVPGECDLAEGRTSVYDAKSR